MECILCDSLINFISLWEKVLKKNKDYWLMSLLLILTFSHVFHLKDEISVLLTDDGLKQITQTKNKREQNYAINHHHHHIVLAARISLTLSRHSSLSFIALGRSSGQQPVSSHSCWMYVRAGRPAFARPCVGIHKSTSLMSSSLLLQQCPACLVHLTWIVFVIGGRWPYSGVLWGVAARTCSGLHAAFLCNCHLVSSPAVLLASM